MATTAGRLGAVLWSWKPTSTTVAADADAAAHQRAARKTHWRQAAQLPPRGVQLCEGGGVMIRAHTAGGELSFELESAPDEVISGRCAKRATTRTPRTPPTARLRRAPLQQVAAAAAAGGGCGSNAAVEAATLIRRPCGHLHRLQSRACGWNAVREPRPSACAFLPPPRPHAATAAHPRRPTSIGLSPCARSTVRS